MNLRCCYIFLFFAFFSSNLKAQDIDFRNTSGNVTLAYLDTIISVHNRTLKVYIGAETKKPQNTIFFNKPFLFEKSAFDSFYIKSSFIQHMIIGNSSFRFPVMIDSTEFDTLFIEHSAFIHPLYIRNTSIRHFKFNQNTFQGRITFVNCSFGSFWMEKSVLLVNVDFINCSFENISFKGSSFKENLHLSGASISGPVNFDSGYFAKTLLLSSLKTFPGTEFSFINTTLPDTLNLSDNISLSKNVDLTKVKRNHDAKRKCSLILFKTDVSKILLDYSFFKLTFPSSLTIDERETIYQGLLQSFKEKAYQESYKLLDIEYKRFQSKNGTLGFLWWVPEYWWNFGYNREYVFYWVFWSLLIFTFINFFALNWLLNSVYTVGNIPLYYRKYNASRLWYSFVYSAVIFFSFSLKIDKINFKNKFGSLYLMFIYILGLICIAYMANFVIQK